MGNRTSTLFAFLTVVAVGYADHGPGLHNRVVRRCDNHTHSGGYGSHTWGPLMITDPSTGYASIRQCGGYGGDPCIPTASGSPVVISTTNSSYTWVSNSSINGTQGAATTMAIESSSGTTLDSPVGAFSGSTTTTNNTTAQVASSSGSSSFINGITTDTFSISTSVPGTASSGNTTAWADWSRSGSVGRGPIWTNTTSHPQETFSQSSDASDSMETVFIITTDVTTLPAHLTITLHEPADTSASSAVVTTSGSVSPAGGANSTLASGVVSSGAATSFSRDFEPVQATSSSGGSSASTQEESSTTSLEGTSTTSSTWSSSTDSSTIDDTNTSGSAVSSSSPSTSNPVESITSANVTSVAMNTSSTAAASGSVYWANSTTFASGVVTSTSCSSESRPTEWRDWNATVSWPATVSSNPLAPTAAPITIPSMGTQTIVCVNATCSAQTAVSSSMVTNLTAITTIVGNNPNASTICFASGRPISCPTANAPWLTAAPTGTTFSTSIISSGTGGTGDGNATTTGARMAMPVKRAIPPHVAWARARMQEFYKQEKGGECEDLKLEEDEV
ncbi:hypothetical protein LTR84_011228 [Exophiala bonariae]|uniref:Ig-like domain-containing protein n=1 Tax=Exophiala bonariae TaxID=1690606 RepID=A0AAV9NMX7_9EURO|nr:hypothetical protein LTR84_011228 [Exophiala bonariae]